MQDKIKQELVEIIAELTSEEKAELLHMWKMLKAEKKGKA